MRSPCLLVAVLACAAGAANAQTVTGSPSADGWTPTGHSMANGIYVRGDAQFSYTVFAQEFSIAAGSNLLSTVGTSTWNVGDRVLSLGGVLVSAPTAPANGWGPSSSYTGAAPDSVTTSFRMTGKFGSDDTSWSSSTVAPGAGNGLGSHSTGHGGLGSVLIGNEAGDITSTASGAIRLPAVAQIYTGSGAINISPLVGRMAYQHSAGIVSGWELFLNITALEALYGTTYADLPDFGDRHIASTQRGTNRAHDALVPTPGAAGLLGLGGLVAARRRRR